MKATAGRARKLILLFLLLGVATACSKSSEKEATTAPPPAPEELRVSAAEVATGLKQIDETVKGVAQKTGTDRAGAEQLDSQIHPVWEKVEGTIKSNDQEAYITFEDNFALLSNAAKDGDVAKAKTASETVSKTVSDYLTKYPG